MAERAIWKGHLRLALVSCPVALYPARHDSTNLHFHFINPETGHRVRMITQDAETGDELSRRDLVKGFEFKKDNYLILTDEDFDAARIESSSVLAVEKFVPADAIDPMYFENTYFLAPDGDAGEDVYVVLREAIRQSNKVALSRIVISRRERAVALMPSGRGLVAHTLYEQKDLHDPAALFDAVPDVRPDPEMVKLATQLVDRQTGRFDPADMDDRYEARLREVIEAKLRGEGIEPDDGPDDGGGNVIDLMAALKKSLAANANSANPKAARATGGGSRAKSPAAVKSAEPPKKSAAKPAAKTAPKPAPKPAAKPRRRAAS